MLDRLLGYHLRRAQTKVFQNFRQSLGHHGVTPGQVGILFLVGNNPGLSQSALARAVAVERASLAETLRYLVAQGWVQRRRADGDKRSNALFLSTAGGAFLDRLLPEIIAHERDASGNLTTRESERLVQLLKKLVDG